MELLMVYRLAELKVDVKEHPMVFHLAQLMGKWRDSSTAHYLDHLTGILMGHLTGHLTVR